MTDVKDPLRQLIDVAVYAPIGLFLLARKELPNLVASGRSRVDNQITLARFIGKLAVKRGSQELKRRLDDADAARNPPLPFLDADSVEVDESAGADIDVDPASLATIATDDAMIQAAASPLPRAVVATDARASEFLADPASPTAGALPIDGYDSLAASQVVVRLGTLTPDELDEVRRHEESHRARRTILGKISQLQAR